MKRIFTPLCLGLMFLAAGLANAGVLHVPGDYSQINAAVQACAVGDTVLVAAGTYNDCVHPTEGAESTPACVIMKSGVTLRGAGPDLTIIDAQTLGRGIFIESVVNCRVENLRVEGAFAAIYGAGLLIREVGTTVEVNDVRVTGCTDGGVICINNSSPTLRRVQMDNNEAKQGGGLAIEENSSPVVIDCVVTTNLAPSGAGIFIRNGCAPVISGTEVTLNETTATNTYGGGMSVQSSTPTLTNCLFDSNVVNGFGGGVAFSDNAGGLMEDCQVVNNTTINTNGQGGGVFTSLSNPTLRRLVVVGNAANGYFGEGGGMFISFNPAPSVENCTIAFNACGPEGVAGGVWVEWFATPAIDKCIISDSSVGVGISCSSATPVITCTDVYGNAGGDDLCGTDGGGNFSADPLYCGIPVGLPGAKSQLSVASAEWALQADSPCAAGNHPGGLCDGEMLGAVAVACEPSAVPLPEIASLKLGNNPNPFNPRTTIFFELPAAGPASLRIYDLSGRLVLERSWEDLPAGRSEFSWQGRDRQGRALPSGIYLYRLDANQQTISRRMSLIK